MIRYDHGFVAAALTAAVIVCTSERVQAIALWISEKVSLPGGGGGLHLRSPSSPFSTWCPFKRNATL